MIDSKFVVDNSSVPVNSIKFWHLICNPERRKHLNQHLLDFSFYWIEQPSTEMPFFFIYNKSNLNFFTTKLNSGFHLFIFRLYKNFLLFCWQYSTVFCRFFLRDNNNLPFFFLFRKLLSTEQLSLNTLNFCFTAL